MAATTTATAAAATAISPQPSTSGTIIDRDNQSNNSITPFTRLQLQRQLQLQLQQNLDELNSKSVNTNQSTPIPLLKSAAIDSELNQTPVTATATATATATQAESESESSFDRDHNNNSINRISRRSRSTPLPPLDFSSTAFQDPLVTAKQLVQQLNNNISISINPPIRSQSVPLELTPELVLKHVFKPRNPNNNNTNRSRAQFNQYQQQQKQYNPSHHKQLILSKKKSGYLRKPGSIELCDLQLGMLVDCYSPNDSNWFTAEIIEINSINNSIKIHWIDYGSEYDTIITGNNINNYIEPFESHTLPIKRNQSGYINNSRCYCCSLSNRIDTILTLVMCDYCPLSYCYQCLFNQYQLKVNTDNTELWECPNCCESAENKSIKANLKSINNNNNNSNRRKRQLAPAAAPIDSIISTDRNIRLLMSNKRVRFIINGESIIKSTVNEGSDTTVHDNNNTIDTVAPAPAPDPARAPAPAPAPTPTPTPAPDGGSFSSNSNTTSVNTCLSSLTATIAAENSINQSIQLDPDPDQDNELALIDLPAAMEITTAATVPAPRVHWKTKLKQLNKLRPTINNDNNHKSARIQLKRQRNLDNSIIPGLPQLSMNIRSRAVTAANPIKYSKSIKSERIDIVINSVVTDPQPPTVSVPAPAPAPNPEPKPKGLSPSTLFAQSLLIGSWVDVYVTKLQRWLTGEITQIPINQSIQQQPQQQQQEQQQEQQDIDNTITHRLPFKVVLFNISSDYNPEILNNSTGRKYLLPLHSKTNPPLYNSVGLVNDLSCFICKSAVNQYERTLLYCNKCPKSFCKYCNLSICGGSNNNNNPFICTVCIDSSISGNNELSSELDYMNPINRWPGINELIRCRLIVNSNSTVNIIVQLAFNPMNSPVKLDRSIEVIDTDTVTDNQSNNQSNQGNVSITPSPPAVAAAAAAAAAATVASDSDSKFHTRRSNIERLRPKIQLNNQIRSVLSINKQYQSIPIANKLHIQSYCKSDCNCRIANPDSNINESIINTESIAASNSNSIPLGSMLDCIYLDPNNSISNYYNQRAIDNINQLVQIQEYKLYYSIYLRQLQQYQQYRQQQQQQQQQQRQLQQLHYQQQQQQYSNLQSQF